MTELDRIEANAKEIDFIAFNKGDTKIKDLANEILRLVKKIRSNDGRITTDSVRRNDGL